MKKRNRRKPASKGKTKKRQARVANIPRARQGLKRAVTIPCNECDGVMDMEKDLKRRPITGVDTEYTVIGDGYADVVNAVDVFELGFECPSCQHWHHVFVDDGHVRGLRDVFNAAQRTAVMGARRRDHYKLVGIANAAETEYKAAFDALNKMMRADGVVVPMSNALADGEEE